MYHAKLIRPAQPYYWLRDYPVGKILTLSDMRAKQLKEEGYVYLLDHFVREKKGGIITQQEKLELEQLERIDRFLAWYASLSTVQRDRFHKRNRN